MPENTQPQAADEYLTSTATKLQRSRPGADVTTRLLRDSAVNAILETARSQDVDLIAMSTGAQRTGLQALVGRTASGVFARANTPRLLGGTQAQAVERHTNAAGG
jgi:nucleotide-binding universal stress UspA family protein